MRHERARYGAIFLFTASLLFAQTTLSACGRGEKGASNVGAKQKQGKRGGAKGRGGGRMRVSRAVVVEQSPVRRGAMDVFGEYTGTIQPLQVAELSAGVSGRATSVRARVGDRVKRGDTLVTIDALPYRQTMREAGAALISARATLKQREVQRDNLARSVKRQKPLVKDRLVARNTLDDLESQLRVAEQQVEVARAAIKQAGARYASAREDYRRTRVTAPFDGVIAARNIEPGRLASTSAALFTVIDPSRLLLHVSVPELDAGRVGIGTRFDVLIDALPDHRCAGRVARVAPALDAQTRALPIEVELDASCVGGAKDAKTSPASARTQRVRPGMSARARAQLGHRDSALLIPRQSLQENADGTVFVWVVRDKKAIKQVIKVGLRSPRDVEVVAGLREGDSVVLRGVEKLRPGAEVAAPKHALGRIDEAAPEKKRMNKGKKGAKQGEGGARGGGAP